MKAADPAQMIGPKTKPQHAIRPDETVQASALTHSQRTVFLWPAGCTEHARGPGNCEIDGSLTKTFKLSEKYGFNVRGAGFNLLNHPMYGNPSGALGSFANGNPKAGFGEITSILNTGATGSVAPRRVEFMMRLEF